MHYESRELIIEQKYAIAGSSCRWMFDFPIQQTKVLIDAEVERVGDVKSLFNRL